VRRGSFFALNEGKGESDQVGGFQQAMRALLGRKRSSTASTSSLVVRKQSGCATGERVVWLCGVVIARGGGGGGAWCGVVIGHAGGRGGGRRGGFLKHLEIWVFSRREGNLWLRGA
jgi:hypothetical protein